MKKFQIILWLVALAVGVALGLLNISWLDKTMNIIAMIFTRLFRLLAVPTIILAIISTLASIGGSRSVGRMFRTTITYTLLTTFAAALVALAYYFIFAPANLPPSVIQAEEQIPDGTTLSYSDHLLSVVPDNFLQPMLDGNILALLLICFAVGIAISRMAPGKPKELTLNALQALQTILNTLIRWLIAILPIGIVAFAAQLTADVGSGAIAGSLGKYVLVILAGNCTQFFIILPIFLLAKRINPLRTLHAMSQAILMALFTKSSAATLPVTIQNATSNLRVRPAVAKFVLPICTTVNMNGCAAFILATSLFIMQNNGIPLTLPSVILWIFIAVISAFGNAGVPMGCYFLTLSLMSGIGADVSIMGIILPIYTIIDMVETAENVWSDSCVCAIANRTLPPDAIAAGTPDT